MARSPSPDISLDDRTSHHNDLSASLLDPTHSRPSTLRSPSIESLRQRDDGPTPNSFNNSQRRGYSSRFREEGDETDQNIRLKNGASETTIIPSPNTPASDLLLSKIPADGRGSPPSWLPFTLKNSFLSLLSMLALALCAATTALLVRSQTNYGLGPDDGSSKILFGWRFSPTLVAVIYVQLTSMLVDDVKRLEPFARLARTKGSEASSSILQKPGAWWNALHDGLSREKNGGDSRGWVLFCATLVNVLGFLLISPLSSALLVSDDVTVPRQIGFLRLTPQTDAPLSLNQGRAAHFRTISHFAQNVTTSPWVTDRWTMLPFWPADWESAPLGSLPSASQTWKVETTVFKNELSCSKMKLDDLSAETVTLGNPDNHTNVTAISATWSSGDCKMGFRITMYGDIVLIAGGASWSNSSEINIGRPFLNETQTDGCKDHDYLLLSEPWEGNGTMNVHLCTTTYSMANVTASVDLSGIEPNISFNESEYTQNRQQVPDSLMNAKTMRDLTLDPEWSSYMLTLGFEKPPSLHGPSTLLWVLYDNNLTAMVEDENVAIRAGEIQQRFFGEMLQSSLIEQGASQYIPIQGHVKTVERRVTATAGPAITLIILLFISSCLLLVAWRCSRLQHRPLNLKTDPSSSAGVTSLVVDSPRTRFSFKDLSQASDKELQGLLKGKRYYTDSKALHEMDSDQAEVANTTTGKSSPGSATKTNWVPRVLRLPTLLALLLCLVVVLVGVVVLYHFAQLSKLYKKAFVYQASISIFNKQVSTVGPFSMVPTLIAVGIGLWWGAIDNNFCRLQPFLAMAKRYRPLSESVYLSYQSSYWMWATIKAILNRHWMLVLVTLGTAVSPIFTTSMSALFQHETGVITETQMLERSLEVRQIPHIFTAVEYTVRDASNFVASVIGQLHGNLTSHWIYTAANQLTLNGSEPAWSKDGWSFVPVDLRNVSFSLPGGTESNHQGGFSQNSRINVSFSTPAIRGRIECSPYEGLSNLSSWLTVTDVSNSSLWTMNPSTGNIKTAYQLGVGFKYNSGLPSMMFPLEPSRNFTNCERCTSIFANPSSVTCCGNGTSLEADPMAAIGYWSPNSNPASWNPRTWQRNITTKWIHGHARVAVEHDVSSSSPHLLFTDIPSIAAMNCMPLVETASAEVTVDPTTGGVRAFSITDEPQTADNAFSDSFLAHRTSNRVQATVTYNATISYGMLFMTQMLTAVNVRSLYGPGRVLGWTIEDRGDNTFNIRDEANGLNLDFMSYSMYSMANKDPSALIDPTVFTRYASKTFSTFFQHFASSNISMERGSLAYQPINASLPSDLPPAVTDVTLMEDAPLADQQDVIHPISHTNRTVVVRVSKQIELLQMNAVAIWLSVSILAWLIIATVTVTIFHRQYLRRLVRNVECLGDVLVLTAGSESLVHVIQEIQAGRIAESEKSRLFARLGWFQDGDGKARWGVEMAEGDMTRPGVQWLDHGGKNIGGTDSV